MSGTFERCPVPLYALEERALGGAHHELAVGRQQGPGLHDQMPVPAQRGEPGHELVPVGVIVEDLGSVDAPAHDVVQGTGGSSRGGLGMPGGSAPSPECQHASEPTSPFTYRLADELANSSR